MEVFYHVKYTDTVEKINKLKAHMKDNNEETNKETESETENGSESNTSSISLSSDCKLSVFLKNSLF